MRVWGGGAVAQQLGERFITQRLHRYYRGYATTQFRRAQMQAQPGKAAIYTYRTMYAGIWVLLHGEVIFPWADLREKVEGEGLFRSALLDEFNMDENLVTERVLVAMRSEFEQLCEAIDLALVNSTLPPDYDGYDVANRLLLRWRSMGWR